LYFKKKYIHKKSVIMTVFWSKNVDKQVDRLPRFIRRKFFAWVDAIRRIGIRKVRVRPGFHDEPLQFDRFGQRSVRLNRSYRVFYVERRGGETELIEVIEVNKHDY
jgi:proteic killer suppression protein